MKDDLNQHQIDEILKALDNMIEEGPWEESNFLKVIGKKISGIREDFVNHINEKHKNVKAEPHLANRVALRSGQQEIYILLYSSEGGKLQNWERILSNLPQQTTSRPIYADEENVKSVIRSKHNPINDAYVAVYVNQSDLLSVPPDKVPVDKLGNNLLSLKSNTLKLENISRFVHTSGTYEYSGGRLTKSSNH